MVKELGPMKEIHEIQEKLYEERKNMIDKEKLAVIHHDQGYKMSLYKQADKKFTEIELTMIKQLFNKIIK